MDSEDEIAEIEEEFGGIDTKFKLPSTIYNKKMHARGLTPDNNLFSSTIRETNELLDQKFLTPEGARLIRNNNVRVRAAIKRIESLERTERNLRAEISQHRHQHNMTEQEKLRDIAMAREASFQIMQQKNNLINLRRTSRILYRTNSTLGFWD